MKLSEEQEIEFETINVQNIDLPIGTEIVIMADKDIVIGKIGNNNEILILKSYFIENFVDEDGNEYIIDFSALSKDLKKGDIFFSQYVHISINDPLEQIMVSTMLDFRLPDGTWNIDLHDCDYCDINELRNGNIQVTHTCKSVDSFPIGGCKTCVMLYHACGEFKECRCTSGGAGYCIHEVSHTRNHAGLGGANMFGYSYVYASGI